MKPQRSLAVALHSRQSYVNPLQIEEKSPEHNLIAEDELYVPISASNSAIEG